MPAERRRSGMAKHKRSKKTPAKTKLEPAWNQLEQTFFASAPSDEPEAPAEPERFDDLEDLVLPAPSDRRWTERVHRLIAALFTPRVDLRVVTIAIASVMLLVGLSAVVFASRH
jgi:hypothetical protein